MIFVRLLSATRPFVGPGVEEIRPALDPVPDLLGTIGLTQVANEHKFSEREFVAEHLSEVQERIGEIVVNINVLIDIAQATARKLGKVDVFAKLDSIAEGLAKVENMT